jgi:hypothetical protein
MQQDGFRPGGPPSGEAITVVHTATSWTEAVVVRGLLDSAGIPSPALGDGNPSDLAPLYCEIEIYALESQADEARQVIAEYLAVGKGMQEEQDAADRRSKDQ